MDGEKWSMRNIWKIGLVGCDKTTAQITAGHHSGPIAVLPRNKSFNTYDVAGSNLPAGNTVVNVSQEKPPLLTEPGSNGEGDSPTRRKTWDEEGQNVRGTVTLGDLSGEEPAT